MYDDVYDTQILEFYKSTFVDANVKFEEYREEIIECLKEFGYARIPEVISLENCEDIVQRTAYYLNIANPGWNEYAVPGSKGCHIAKGFGIANIPPMRIMRAAIE